MTRASPPSRTAARCAFFRAALTITLVASAARAQEPVAPIPPAIARAESFAEQAYGAYQKHDYEGAVALYEQAYAASPSANILYNIAKVYDGKLRDRAQAIAYYTRYVDDPAAEPERARTTRERIVLLRELDQAPQQAAIPARPSTPTPQSAAAPRTQPVSPGMSPLRISGVVFSSVGVASLALGTGFGIVARSDADRAHELCDGNTCSSQRGIDAADEARRSANLATAAFAVGGTLALLGVGMLLWGEPGSSREHPALVIGPYAQRDTLGTQLAGRW